MAEYNFNHNVLNYIHLKLFPQKKKKAFPSSLPIADLQCLQNDSL